MMEDADVFAAETAETEQPVLEPVNQEELAAELVEAETAEAEARKEAEAEAFFNEQAKIVEELKK